MRTKPRPSLLLLSALVLAPTAACTHPAEMAKDFVDKPLAGQIQGKDWQYKYAYINPTLRTPNEDDFVFIFLPYKPADACPKRDDQEVADRRQIMVAAPKSMKLTRLKTGTPRTLTFQYPQDNGGAFVTSASTGKFQLTSINDSVVKGKLYAQRNNGHWVSGTFTAVVCNTMDFK